MSSDDDEFTFDFFDEDPEPMTAEDIVIEEEPEVKIEPVELSDDEVDDIFSDIANSIENDAEVLAATALVIEAEATVAKAAALYNVESARLAEIAAERKELEKKIATLMREKTEIDARRWDSSTMLNTAKREVDQATRKVELAKAAATQRMKYKALGSEYLKLAKGKRWWDGFINNHGAKMQILPHQWTGAKYLASAGRCILGDGMGLGKTLTAIAALDLVKSDRALVVAPADVNTNFVNEIRMWAPHRNVLTIKGMSKAERNVILDTIGVLNNVVIVVNYEAWRKDFNLIEKFLDLQFDTVILDEAHIVKNTSSDAYEGTTKFILGDNVCPKDGTALVKGSGRMRSCPKCYWEGESFDVYYEDEKRYANYDERYWMSKATKNVWTMTGTPILNAPGDLFPMLHLIDPINFVKKNDFLATYCEHSPYTGRWTFRSGGLTSLTKRLSGRFLARTMEDAGIILPEQKPITHLLEISAETYPDQFNVIQQLSKYAQFVLSDGRTLNTFATIDLITRQRQANVWPGGIEIWDKEVCDDFGNVIVPKTLLFKVSEEVTESIKIDKAIEIITEYVSQGKRVALFSQFTTALKEIQARVDGLAIEDSDKVVRSVRYDGKTPDAIKEQVRTNFNAQNAEEAKWDVVLANYKSGGVGLNFTAVEHTIILDEEWNPGKRDQAYARTQRIGQDKNTFVHLIQIDKTIDKWLSDLIAEKEDMIDGFNTETVDIQTRLLKAIESGDIIS